MRHPRHDARRRRLLKSALAAGLALGGGRRATAAVDDPWTQAQAIVDSFAVPTPFRDEDFVVTEHGAKPCKVAPTPAWVSFVDEARIDSPVPGSADCRPAIAAAIAACHAAGGGRVVIPPGDWYCAGPIVLRSHVHLHLRAGAHLYFSNDPADYARHGEFDCGANGRLTVTRWEGNDLLNFSPLVYAHGQQHIALTGEDWTSILDGQGGVRMPGSSDCWWSWKGRGVAAGRDTGRHVGHSGRTEVHLNPLNPKSLREVAPQLSAAQADFIQGPGDRWRSDAACLRALAEARVPPQRRVFGLGHFLRPHMVQFISCSDVLCQGYQVRNAPFWQHNPVHCRQVHARRIHANSMGPNNDGFDPEACDGVLIEDCEFNTGDDCIAIDAGKGPDTQFGPAQNIVVQNCRMHSGHGALTFGSIMSGGVQNVYAQNLVFENRDWQTDPLNVAIRLKCSMSRGGFLRNIHVRNVSVPHGIRTQPGLYSSLPGSLVPDRTVATSAGAVVTIDCGYDATLDNVRTRPPEVSGVHISLLTVGDVATPTGRHSCWQAIVVLGPIASDYNGPAEPPPAIRPVTDITLTDCDFGHPVQADAPVYLFNVQGLKLKNVRIGEQVHDETLSA